jgi:hypothetical protein
VYYYVASAACFIHDDQFEATYRRHIYSTSHCGVAGATQASSPRVCCMYLLTLSLHLCVGAVRATVTIFDRHLIAKATQALLLSLSHFFCNSSTLVLAVQMQWFCRLVHTSNSRRVMMHLCLVTRTTRAPSFYLSC